MEAATQIRNYRQKNKLSQAGFARLIGVTQTAVSHWELAHLQPSAVISLVIDRATGGAISARELRPDLPWPSNRTHADPQPSQLSKTA